MKKEFEKVVKFLRNKMDNLDIEKIVAKDNGFLWSDYDKKIKHLRFAIYILENEK